MASRHAGAAVELGQVMIIAGIGCRRAVSGPDVAAAIEMAMSHVGEGNLPDRIAIPASKAGEAGVLAAAESLAIAIMLVTQEALEKASERTHTRSARSLAEMNVHCVCESAALAAAGADSRLLLPRVVLGNVTCALAASEIDP